MAKLYKLHAKIEQNKATENSYQIFLMCSKLYQLCSEYFKDVHLQLSNKL